MILLILLFILAAASITLICVGICKSPRTETFANSGSPPFYLAVPNNSSQWRREVNKYDFKPAQIYGLWSEPEIEIDSDGS